MQYMNLSNTSISKETKHELEKGLGSASRAFEQGFFLYHVTPAVSRDLGLRGLSRYL